jgi:hypothetical protein
MSARAVERELLKTLIPLPTGKEHAKHLRPSRSVSGDDDRRACTIRAAAS